MAFKNLIDNTSTTVTANTPGMTVDLSEHTTHRLRATGVPVRLKVCVSSTAGNDTGAVKLLDSTGTAVITCLVNNPSATTDPVGDWYWADGYVPASLAKYDVHYGGNTSGTLTVFSASLYQIDWTTDPVTGSASLTLGALATSATATAEWIGTANLTLGALTVASTGTVEVKGDSSMTLGALTAAATGTVANSGLAYRASAAGGSTAGAGSSASVTQTPAANDLMVAFVTMALGIPDAMSDNNSDGLGGSWTQLQVQGWKSTSSNDSNVAAYVRPSLIGSATSTTFTCTDFSGVNTAREIVIVNLSGGTLAGASAVVQSAEFGDSASSTPAITFGASCNTANLTIGCIASSDTTQTEPSGWTERQEVSQSTPTTALEVVTRDNGFTGTTITWGATTTAEWGGIIVELKAS